MLKRPNIININNGFITFIVKLGLKSEPVGITIASSDKLELNCQNSKLEVSKVKMQ